jgi:peroxiredoxin (alkyl hydroperoxide reductase subunit C)
MVKIGQKIPDFELDSYQNNEFGKIKISGYLGKWLVLFFYPADFTFVCPTELSELAESYEVFKGLNAEVLSVSTDTKYTHLAWHNESPAIKKINFPMLSDPTGKLCREMGTYIEEEGLSLRGTFIIDPDGILRAVEIHDNSIGRSAAELIRKLQAAIFVREHHGEVCPASWRPGSAALKPGPTLVGKI